MSKRGKEYEQLVGRVARVFDTRATVEVGKWVVGPDGRRELDVLVSGSSQGSDFRILIECKDFNRNTTGPVGIGYIDALDSKRKDLGVSASLLCCNAGFTREAIRKASRVGIGLVALTKSGDPHLRHRVFDEIYFRKVRITNTRIDLHPHIEGHPEVPPLGILNGDTPLAHWAHHRVALIVLHNPVVSGSFFQEISFTKPLTFVWDDGGNDRKAWHRLFD